jgi:hypothetical protein
MRLLKTFIALGGSIAGGVRAQEEVSLTLDATMDIYRAGGYSDGSDGIAPAVFTFPASPWRTMTFPAVGGAWSCNSGPFYGADGATTSSPSCYNVSNITGPVGTFSGFQGTDFGGALVGVFLGETLPGSAPAALRFYASNSSQGGIQTDFLTLTPKIGQVFFIGDGLTGTGIGTVQTFVVPAGATHLYLGYIDSCTQTAPGVPGCFAGNTGSLNVNARVQYYIPDWYKPTTSTAPSARCCTGLAYDAAGYYTLLFGGGNGGALFPRVRYNDTWVWSNGWYQVFPATSPSARVGPGTAYDPITGTVVLFGGQNINGNYLNDTWIWDGVSWTQQLPAVSPPNRELDEQSMAYDAATGTVVLFGGAALGGGLADTWEWNGRTKTWKQDFPASSPPPQSTPLAYDAARATVVLFGQNNNDTWTWDGTTWTQQFPAISPPPRGLPALAYDPSLGQVVLFGGSQGPPSAMNDTWAWNGITWTQLNLPTEPGGRWAAGMVFEPLNDGRLLFGGELAGDPFGNDTWFLLPVPLL